MLSGAGAANRAYARVANHGQCCGSNTHFTCGEKEAMPLGFPNTKQRAAEVRQHILLLSGMKANWPRPIGLGSRQPAWTA